MRNYLLDTDNGVMSTNGYMIIKNNKGGGYTAKYGYLFEDKALAKAQCPHGYHVVKVDMMSGKMVKV